MRILAVDTSSQHGSVCVSEEGEVLGEVRLRRSVQHSEGLFRSIDFLFQSVPFRLEDVDLFVAARGPGSFTGLRVGLAAMEGFASAFQKPGAGVSSLEALAWRCGEPGLLLGPTIDARRGEVYGALYIMEFGILKEVRSPSVMTPAAWFASMPDARISFCGDGALRYREFLTRETWSLKEIDLFLASALVDLAYSPNRGPLSPLYVRRTEAEIARERKDEDAASPNPKS